jgi:hypothetical protein
MVCIRRYTHAHTHTSFSSAHAFKTSQIDQIQRTGLDHTYIHISFSPAHALRAGQIDQIQSTGLDQLFLIDSLFLHKDSQREDRVRARGLLVAEGLCSAALFVGALKNVENILSGVDWALFYALYVYIYVCMYGCFSVRMCRERR